MRLTARSEATEPSDSTTRAEGGTEAGLAQRLDRDEIPVLGLAAHARRHPEFAARRALLDRQRASGAVLGLAEDGEDARLQLVEDLDHPARIGRLLACSVGIELDAHQDAGADAGRRRRVAFRQMRACREIDARGCAAPVRPRPIRRAWRRVRRRGRARRYRRPRATADGPARQAPCGRARPRPRSGGP